MKTNKILKLGLLCMSINFGVQAQPWSTYGVGLSAANVIVADISMPSPNVAWGILAGFGQGVCGGVAPYYVKTVNGSSWTGGAISLPIDITPYCISAINKDTAWVAASDIGSNSSGYIYKTVNGGSTWTEQSTANSTDALRFVHFYNANQGVATGDSSTFITNNGGATWVFNGALPVPVAQVGSGTTNFLLNAYEVVGDNIWLGDVFGFFYKSSNKGMTWSLMPNGIQSSIKGIAFKDDLHGMAAAARQTSGGSGGPGTPGDFSVMTSDGGITWQAMPITFNSVNVVNSVAKYDVGFVPGTNNTYIATSEYDTWAAFSAITTDGGLTWNLLDSTEKHTAVAFSSPTKGYTGAYINTFSQGIFKWGGTMPNKMDEFDNQSQFAIYPNPSKDYVCIRQQGRNNFDNYSFDLMDLTGRILLSKKNLKNGLERIDLQDIPSGHFLLNIYTKDNLRKIYKFTHHN